MTLTYHEPRSVAEASEVLTALGPNASAVAGGIDVARGLRGQHQVKHLVSLRHIAELHGISGSRSDGLTIGSMTAHRRAERSAVVADYCTALVRAFAGVGTIRIRNQGTVGGSVVQADPRYDPPGMLLALGAEAEFARSGTTKRIPLDDFLLGPYVGGCPLGHVLQAIKLPPITTAMAATFVKFVPAGAAERSTVTVAGSALLTRGTCVSARVYLGAIGGMRVRLRSAEASFVGRTLDAATCVTAAEAGAHEARDVLKRRLLSPYEEQLVLVTLRRAFADLSRQQHR